MALSGNTRELSLADLIVVKAQDPGNHRLRLSGPAGDGLLFIESGRIVHAAYGELPPLDAAYVLVTEHNVDFEVEDDTDVTGHTFDVGAQELLMEAMRRLDEGLLRRPKPATIELATSSSGVRRPPPRPRRHEARKSPEEEALRRAMGRVLFTDPDAAGIHEKSSAPKVAALVIGIVVVAFGALVAWRGGWVSEEARRDPLEASDLAGPRDALPMLTSGAPAVAPAGVSADEVAVLPTILLRVFVDPRGRVLEASVSQPGSGLDTFEAAAVAAVRNYRFTPGRREGVPVSVWINWPVYFIRDPVASEAVPIDARLIKSQREGDELPELVDGASPPTPFPGRSLRPEIACRLLVDASGNVADAEIAAPNPELRAYERAALDAVRSYRFTPARREGVTVAAWIDWPVTFQ